MKSNITTNGCFLVNVYGNRSPFLFCHRCLLRNTTFIHLKMSKALSWVFHALLMVWYASPGNAITFLVIWHRKHSLKRTTNLLTNLTVADVFGGTTKLIQTISNSQAVASDEDVLSFINQFFGSASALCPSLLSWEHTYTALTSSSHFTN